MVKQAEHAFICPHCGKPATAVERGSAIWPGFDDKGRSEGPPAEWTLVQCDRCAMPTVEVREDYGGGFDEDERTIVYPQPRRLSFSIPSELRKGWQEAQTCFDAKAFTASVIMVRRTLEATCKDQGVTKRTLDQSLKELRAQGKIDGTLAEWADALRLAGNKGAHATDEWVSRENAEDALAFAEALLDHVYVLRKRFDDFKKRLKKK